MGCPVVCWMFNGIPGLHPPGAPSPSCDNQMSQDIKRVPWGHSCAVENLWAACSAASSLPNRQVILPACPTTETCRSFRLAQGGRSGPSLVLSLRPETPGRASCSLWLSQPLLVIEHSRHTPLGLGDSFLVCLARSLPQYTQISGHMSPWNGLS